MSTGPELHEYQPGDPRLPDGDRGSKLLAPLRAEGGQSVAIAVVSTIVFFVVLSLIVVNSPGWDEVKQAFFSRAQFKESFPGIVRAFLVNVRLFMISEVLILALGARARGDAEPARARSSSRSGCSRCSTPTSSAGSRRSS